MGHTSLPAQAQMLTAVACISPVVYIVDDDVSVRESLETLIEEAGWRAEAFASASEFLCQTWSDCPCCLVLDIGLPDLNGLEVQRRVLKEQTEMPIVFVTGQGDVSTSVQAMKAGAVEFLTKPYEPAALVAAVRSSLERSSASLQQRSSLRALREKYETLSPREREVMTLVVQGELNKQVAAALGISEITVKAHRGSVMRKMYVRSLPALVNIAARLGMCSAGSI